MNRIKNAGKNMSIMLTGVAIGAVLAGGSTAAAAGIVAEPTWQPIFVDGRQVQMTAYNIAGHNYVKLRDIGEKVGFNVYWSDGVQVDSDAPYTGEAPKQEVPTSSMTQDLSESQQEIVDLTNALRREHGLPELSVDNRLMEAAQSCSAQGFTAHHNREECEAVLESGYPYGFGSNLTVFTASSASGIAQRAVSNWANSPGHLRTMLDPDCDSIGVGITVSGGRTYCYMFVGNPTANNPYA